MIDCPSLPRLVLIPAWGLEAVEAGDRCKVMLYSIIVRLTHGVRGAWWMNQRQSMGDRWDGEVEGPDPQRDAAPRAWQQAGWSLGPRPRPTALRSHGREPDGRGRGEKAGHFLQQEPPRVTEMPLCCERRETRDWIGHHIPRISAAMQQYSCQSQVVQQSTIHDPNVDDL